MMTRRIARRLKHKEKLGTAWKVLMAVCMVSVLWLLLVIYVIAQTNDVYDRGFFKGYDVGSDASVQAVIEDRAQAVIEDRAADYMPVHLQIDPQWRNTSYSTGTIESHGCGLCCLSMMVSYLDGREVYPTDLVQYQDKFLQANVNDQDAMCKWVSEAYCLEWSGEQWGFNEHIDEMLDAGYVVMCGMEGKLGDSEYEGHVVLVYGKTEDGYLIRDPDSAENSVHVFSAEELSDVTWGSLNGLRV